MKKFIFLTILIFAFSSFSLADGDQPLGGKRCPEGTTPNNVTNCSQPTPNPNPVTPEPEGLSVSQLYSWLIDLFDLG